MVTVFQGEIRSVTALLDAAARTPFRRTPGSRFGLLHTAADSAVTCRRLLADGEGLDGCWRFGILQTLDDYTSTRRRGGPELAAQVFSDEPPRTGAPQLDAAFAALADYLAERDGWTTPQWALDPTRAAETWYPAVPMILRAEADTESPQAFRSRGVLITSRSLDRA
ncbi:MAG: hypothetical protein GX678_04970 [Actinomycetales bacterium]|nr:hypothetical protein [Actinomycetales bacterium]